LNRTEARVCLYAALLALGFCLLLGVSVCRRFTRASSACPGPFDQLQQGFEEATERLAVLTADPATPVNGVLKQAIRDRDYLQEHVFAQPRRAGLPWLLGTGYIDAWRRLHAVEEALLTLEPIPRVVEAALLDEDRLTGSNIPQSATLLQRLRLAVADLSQTAPRYLSVAATPGDPGSPEEARVALAQVRDAINDFRDGRRDGLVRARNRLFATVIFAGITGCVLLYVAILFGATKESIVAVAAFYLVGGVVGLVKQLHSASIAEGADQDDYGLGVVRLVQTPLFSGLAAVGGVVLVKLTQGQGGGNQFSLSDTFSLHNNPYGLVAAGFFGLTPALLLAGLQQRIDQFKGDLSNSGPSAAQPQGGR
jgi:hypothetical protein